MKLLIVLVLIAAALVIAEDTYDSRYDDFDVDEVINNEKLFRNYFMCFHDSGPCTADGKQLKAWIPEAIDTSCAKCTEKQKALIAKSIKAAKAKYPKEYDEMLAKYDPEGNRVDELAAFIGKYSA